MPFRCPFNRRERVSGSICIRARFLNFVVQEGELVLVRDLQWNGLPLHLEESRCGIRQIEVGASRIVRADVTELSGGPS